MEKFLCFFNVCNKVRGGFVMSVNKFTVFAVNSNGTFWTFRHIKVSKYDGSSHVYHVYVIRCHWTQIGNKYPVKSLSGRYEIWRMSSLLKNSTQVYRIPDKGNYTAWLMFSQQCPIIHATLIRILFRVPWLPITTAFYHVYYYYAGFTSDFLGSWQQKTSAPNQLLITGFVLLKVWIILPFPVSSLQWFCWLLHVLPWCLITT